VEAEAEAEDDPTTLFAFEYEGASYYYRESTMEIFQDNDATTPSIGQYFNEMPIRCHRGGDELDIFGWSEFVLNPGVVSIFEDMADVGVATPNAAPFALLQITDTGDWHYHWRQTDSEPFYFATDREDQTAVYDALFQTVGKYLRDDIFRPFPHLKQTYWIDSKQRIWNPLTTKSVGVMLPDGTLKFEPPARPMGGVPVRPPAGSKRKS
jgi:hypothetical protein